MSNQNYFDVLIEIDGPASSLDSFALQHLAGGVFSFNSIAPMPVKLDFDMNNFVEDGYNALYGDWQTLTGRWMFKEAAAQHGYPFPLESREQIIECVKALGEHGEKRLALGHLFKSNLDHFGHGHRAQWRKANWGIEGDAGEVVMEVSSSAIRIAFSICGTPPKKALSLFSKPYPDLNFEISCVSESGKRGKKILMKKGKEVGKPVASDEELGNAIWSFRRRAGLQCFARQLGNDVYLQYVEMNERGRLMFKGLGIALEFVLRRLSSGETIDALALKMPELTANHIQVLKAISLTPK